MHLKPDSETNTSNQQHGNNNGNAIVRVESAADEGLDELFKAVMSPNDGQSRLPQQVPMRQRRLPPSFFRPPSAASSSNSVASASHSRESSLDGGYQSGQTPVTGQPTNNTNNGPNKITTPPVLSYSAANGMAIIHPRANSSPAALQPANGSLSVNGQAFNSNELKQANESTSGGTTNNTGSTNISHFRQMSYDLEQIRLPDGWEMSYTANGERYFLNHKEKTTTWEDPRKKMIEDMLHRNGIQPIIQPTTTTQASVVPQPPNNNQPPTTSTTATSGLGVPEPEHLSYVDPSIVPLPDGWEQAQTSSGDIYFISHIDQTTTWFHPSIPRNLQMKRVQQQSCTIQLPPFQTNNNQQSSANIPSELVAALKNMNTSCQTAPSPVASATIISAATNPLDIALKSQQNQHLRDLELERERMKQRQEELLQSSLLNGTASNILLSSSTEPTPSPFMMQQQQNECHSRQESIDSGLDLGNSSNYSMPHTPDDFLRSLTLNTANNNNGNSATATNLANSTTNSANANSNSNNNNNNNNVAPISDDLAFEAMQISGLDLDSESMDFMQGLDMDLLSNVEELLNSNKDNIMTWL